MKILKLFFVLVVILFVSGFGYFAVTDIPTEQREVSKEIPNERFFDE